MWKHWPETVILIVMIWNIAYNFWWFITIIWTQPQNFLSFIRELYIQKSVYELMLLNNRKRIKVKMPMNTVYSRCRELFEFPILCLLVWSSYSGCHKVLSQLNALFIRQKPGPWSRRNEWLWQGKPHKMPTTVHCRH